MGSTVAEKGNALRFAFQVLHSAFRISRFVLRISMGVAVLSTFMCNDVLCMIDCASQVPLVEYSDHVVSKKN